MRKSSNTTRKVYCADSLKWLRGKQYNAIVTSLPDLSELDLSLNEYQTWLIEASTILLNSLQEDGCIIFYQTNKKHKGVLIDKDFLISRLFYENGYKKVFHKIILRRKPETIDLYRPSYSNMFCFSKKISAGLGNPDVIYAGEMLTPDSIGINACIAAIDFIKKKVDAKVIIDPFCGVGTVLAVANKHRFDAIGIDINKSHVLKAKKLQLD